MARYIQDVIAEILPLIPETEVDLRESLADIADSACFAPPQMQGFWWNEACDVLNWYSKKFVGAEWEAKMCAIVNDPAHKGGVLR